jgi:hypothetical protein
VAWTLGMLPGTLIGASSESGGSAPHEPSDTVVYGLAVLMGLAAGAILGTPQYFVLCRHVRRAVLWIGANALAWVPGMVLAFVAADFIFSARSRISTSVLAIGTLVAIGAVVGSIHGLALVWLVHRNGHGSARQKPAEAIRSREEEPYGLWPERESSRE